MVRTWCGAAIALLLAPWGTPVSAQTPRELLTEAAFQDRDRAAALRRVERAHSVAAAKLEHAPGDREASVIHATAVGYLAKLTGSRAEALRARKQFEALIGRDPRNAEAHAGLGAWHAGVIAQFGRLVGRAAVGAQKDTGLAALDRSVALGGGRAMFPALNALLRLKLDAGDPKARAMAEAATRAAAPTAVDRIMQRAAAAVLVPLRAGDRKKARALAARLLPFGRLPDE